MKCLCTHLQKEHGRAARLRASVSTYFPPANHFPRRCGWSPLSKDVFSFLNSCRSRESRVGAGDGGIRHRGGLQRAG